MAMRERLQHFLSFLKPSASKTVRHDDERSPLESQRSASSSKISETSSLEGYYSSEESCGALIENNYFCSQPASAALAAAAANIPRAALTRKAAAAASPYRTPLPLPPPEIRLHNLRANMILQQLGLATLKAQKLHLRGHDEEDDEAVAHHLMQEKSHQELLARLVDQLQALEKEIPLNRSRFQRQQLRQRRLFRELHRQQQHERQQRNAGRRSTDLEHFFAFHCSDIQNRRLRRDFASSSPRNDHYDNANKSRRRRVIDTKTASSRAGRSTTTATTTADFIGNCNSSSSTTDSSFVDSYAPRSGSNSCGGIHSDEEEKVHIRRHVQPTREQQQKRQGRGVRGLQGLHHQPEPPTTPEQREGKQQQQRQVKHQQQRQVKQQQLMQQRRELRRQQQQQQREIRRQQRQQQQEHSSHQQQRFARYHGHAFMQLSSPSYRNIKRRTLQHRYTAAQRHRSAEPYWLPDDRQRRPVRQARSTVQQRWIKQQQQQRRQLLDKQQQQRHQRLEQQQHQLGKLHEQQQHQNRRRHTVGEQQRSCVPKQQQQQQQQQSRSEQQQQQGRCVEEQAQQQLNSSLTEQQQKRRSLQLHRLFSWPRRHSEPHFSKSSSTRQQGRQTTSTEQHHHSWSLQLRSVLLVKGTKKKKLQEQQPAEGENQRKERSWVRRRRGRKEKQQQKLSPEQQQVQQSEQFTDTRQQEAAGRCKEEPFQFGGGRQHSTLYGYPSQQQPQDFHTSCSSKRGGSGSVGTGDRIHGALTDGDAAGVFWRDETAVLPSPCFPPEAQSASMQPLRAHDKMVAPAARSAAAWRPRAAAWQQLASRDEGWMPSLAAAAAAERTIPEEAYSSSHTSPRLCDSIAWPLSRGAVSSEEARAAQRQALRRRLAAAMEQQEDFLWQQPETDLWQQQQQQHWQADQWEQQEENEFWQQELEQQKSLIWKRQQHVDEEMPYREERSCLPEGAALSLGDDAPEGEELLLQQPSATQLPLTAESDVLERWQQLWQREHCGSSASSSELQQQQQQHEFEGIAATFPRTTQQQQHGEAETHPDATAAAAAEQQQNAAEDADTNTQVWLKDTRQPRGPQAIVLEGRVHSPGRRFSSLQLSTPRIMRNKQEQQQEEQLCEAAANQRQERLPDPSRQQQQSRSQAEEKTDRRKGLQQKSRWKEYLGFEKTQQQKKYGQEPRGDAQQHREDGNTQQQQQQQLRLLFGDASAAAQLLLETGFEDHVTCPVRDSSGSTGVLVDDARSTCSFEDANDLATAAAARCAAPPAEPVTTGAGSLRLRKLPESPVTADVGPAAAAAAAASGAAAAGGAASADSRVLRVGRRTPRFLVRRRAEQQRRLRLTQRCRSCSSYSSNSLQRSAVGSRGEHSRSDAKRRNSYGYFRHDERSSSSCWSTVESSSAGFVRSSCCNVRRTHSAAAAMSSSSSSEAQRFSWQQELQSERSSRRAQQQVAHVEAQFRKTPWMITTLQEPANTNWKPYGSLESSENLLHQKSFAAAATTPLDAVAGAAAAATAAEFMKEDSEDEEAATAAAEGLLDGRLAADQVLFEEIYDDSADERDEKWVRDHLRVGDKETDGILACPGCFMPVCYQCRRDEKVISLYRAVTARNVQLQQLCEVEEAAAAEQQATATNRCCSRGSYEGAENAWTRLQQQQQHIFFSQQQQKMCVHQEEKQQQRQQEAMHEEKQQQHEIVHSENRPKKKEQQQQRQVCGRDVYCYEDRKDEEEEHWQERRQGVVDEGEEEEEEEGEEAKQRQDRGEQEEKTQQQQGEDLSIMRHLRSLISPLGRRSSDEGKESAQAEKGHLFMKGMLDRDRSSKRRNSSRCNDVHTGGRSSGRRQSQSSDGRSKRKSSSGRKQNSSRGKSSGALVKHTGINRNTSSNRCRSTSKCSSCSSSGGAYLGSSCTSREITEMLSGPGIGAAVSASVPDGETPQLHAVRCCACSTTLGVYEACSGVYHFFRILPSEG